MSFIHTRLRDEKDDDITAWYAAQADKSEAVREAIRVKMHLDAEGSTQEAVKGAVTTAAGAELPRLTEAVTSAADAELPRLREAVIAAASEQMARLPGIVAAAVSEALAAYRLAPAEPAHGPGKEDPELATRLDGQLDAFFDDSNLSSEGGD